MFTESRTESRNPFFFREKNAGTHAYTYIHIRVRACVSFYTLENVCMSAWASVI